jgi:hypothetical protein
MKYAVIPNPIPNHIDFRILFNEKRFIVQRFLFY